MKNGYRILGTAFAAFGMALGAYAGNPPITTLPPAGVINLDEYTAGLNSVELEQKGSINRQSDGFVTLTRNGEEIRRIPASNVPMLYCADGFERGDYGKIHVDFWMTTAGKQGLKPGKYTVTFDEGVVLFGEEAVPNEAFSVDFVINTLELSPAFDSYVYEIDKINVIFPEGARVQYKGGVTIENRLSDRGTVVPEVTVNGNEAVMSFNPPLTDVGSYAMMVNADSFTWTVDGVTEKNSSYFGSYNVVQTKDIPSIDPAPGEYIQLDGVVKDGVASSSFFRLDFPEGEELQFTSMGSCYLYPVREDGSLDTSNKSYRFAAVADAEDKSFVYLNSTTAQTVFKPVAGEYMLLVGSNAYFMKGMVSNQEMMYGPYTFVAGDEGRNFTVTPNDAEVVSELTTISLDFPEGSSLEWMPGNYGWLSDGVADYAIYPGIDGSRLYFDVNPVVTKEGSWSLDIAQSALMVNGQATPVRVVYTVGAAEQKGADFDIEMTSMKPCTSATDPTVDISDKTFETVQMVFNMGNLQPVEGAQVRIEGPGYNQVASILFNMNGWDGKSTTMKANFSADPIYNGEYTLTIPQGAVGDAAYIEDHNTGHANAEVRYVFDVIGGKDPAGMTVDTSLAVNCNIAMGTFVETLDDLVLTFDEPVYFNEDAELQVKWLSNLQSMSYRDFGVATLSRVSDTEVKVNFDPQPEPIENAAEYRLIIKEGTFWNEEHNLDANAGKVNAEISMNWYMEAAAIEVEVISHTPATDAYVEGFDTGEGIIVNTTNNEAVGSMEVTMIQYELGNDWDGGTVILFGEVSTAKTEDGAPCWLNEGEYMPFGEQYFYEVDFVLYDEYGEYLTDGMFEFYGAYGQQEGADYDIEMTSMKPCTSATDPTVDISDKTFETVQMVFNMGNLQPVEGAQVRIEGPGYNQVASILFNMNGWDGKSTTMKANFSADPIYNGEYTLTIPQGAVGDAAYIEDHNTGHANAEVRYVFDVIGGKDPAGMTVDTSLAVNCNIAMGTFVETLDDLVLTFDEPVYFDEDVELQVKWLSNLQSMSYRDFGVATLSRMSDTEVKVNFDPQPEPIENAAEYRLIIKEGTFWNEEHNLDANAGKVNAEISMNWYMEAAAIEVEVISHTPATDAYVEGFDAGEGIIINTNNNDAVGSIEVTMIQYELDNDWDGGTVILYGEISTAKTEDGAPCWLNEGEYMPFGEKYFYEVDFVLYDEYGEYLTDGMFEFYGASKETSVASVIVDLDAPVYNLQGIRVADNARNLAAGLYIINGRKYIKK